MNHVLLQKDNYEEFSGVLPISELPRKNRYTFGAYDDDGVVAGAISFYLLDDQYEIDWLYVSPTMRRMGVATELMDEVFAFIRRTGEIYPIHTEYEVTMEDLSLYGFFLGRSEMDTDFSHYRYYVTPAEIKESEALQGSTDVDLTYRKYFSLPNQYQNSYLSQITSNHTYLIEDRNRWKSECISDLCRVVCKGDKLLAAIFIMARSDGKLELSYLYSTSAVATKMILTRTASAMTKDYPGSKLIFDCVGRTAEPLAKKLFPYAQTVCIYESVW